MAARSPIEFRDRTRRLTAFGILATLAGGASVMLGLLHLALPWLPGPAGSNAPASDLGSALMGLALYTTLGAILIRTGVASMQRRRWVRTAMLTLAWTWLVTGALGLVLVVVLLDDLIALSTGDLELTPGVVRFVEVFLVGATALGGVLVPAAFVWAYHDRDVARTCEAYDPAPSWTDRCPAPVLGLSLGMGLLALMLVPMAVRPVLPLFGFVLTGVPGAAAALGLAALFGYLARVTFELRPSGWWMTTVAFLLVGTAMTLSFLRVEPADYLRHVGYPEEPLRRLEASGRLGGRVRAIWTAAGAAMTLASVGYMVAIRKHFPARDDGLRSR